jgi:putative FmdB family regulatory protein
MPIYEFKCKNCGEKFEVFVFSHGDASIICGNCGSENIERLMSGFAHTGASSGSSGEASGSSCAGAGRFS